MRLRSPKLTRKDNKRVDVLKRYLVGALARCGFAWTIQGSPKKTFRLMADAIMDADATVLERLCGEAGEA